MQLLEKINTVLGCLATSHEARGLTVSDILNQHQIPTTDKECSMIYKMLIVSDCIEPMEISGIKEYNLVNITQNGLLTHCGGGYGAYQ